MTTASIDFLPLTHDIAAAIRASGAKSGVVHVVVPRADAGLIIHRNNEVLRSRVREKEALLPRTLALPFADGDTMLAPHEEVIVVDYEVRPQRRELVIIIIPEPGTEAE